MTNQTSLESQPVVGSSIQWLTNLNEAIQAGDDNGLWQLLAQHRDQVDDAARAERVFEPRAQRVEMAVRPVLDRRPKPQGIFDREHDKREKLDDDEGGGILAVQFGYRLERHGDEIGQDQQHQRAVDFPGAIGFDRRGLQTKPIGRKLLRRMGLTSENWLRNWVRSADSSRRDDLR